MSSKPPALIIFVGLPGSGKSTYYFAHFADTHVHVSKDLLPRGGRQETLVEKALAAGRSVVVDNTNPRRADRSPLLELARRFGARTIAVLVTATVAECLRRNAAREGRARVPGVAIYVAAKKLEPPSCEEGFDEVLEASMAEDGSWSVGTLLARQT